MLFWDEVPTLPLEIGLLNLLPKQNEFLPFLAKLFSTSFARLMEMAIYP